MATAKAVCKAARGARSSGRSPGGLFPLARSIFTQTRHLHGLTKTSLRLLRIAAELRMPHLPPNAGPNGKPDAGQKALADLPAAPRAIVQAAIDGHFNPSLGRAYAGPLSSKQKAIEAIAARIAAVVHLAEAVAQLRPHADCVPIEDDGLSVELLVAAGRSLSEVPHELLQNTALWNRVALRPCTLSLVTGQPRASAWLRAEQPMAEAGRHILQRHLEYFLARQYGLPYMADVEYVHELRVATRRLRAAMRMFGRSFRGRLRGPSRRLRALAALLGQARDCDVFLAFLRGYVKKNPKTERWLKGLVRSQKRCRAKAYANLRRELVAPATQRFLRNLHESLQGPAGGDEELIPTTKGLERPVATVARKSLRDALGRVYRYGRKLEELTIEQQHTLRIDCKKLRYSAEFVAELYPPELEKLLAPAVALQDMLGEAHDADVYIKRIADYFRRARSAKSMKVVRAIRKHLLARRRRCLARAGKLWKSFAADRTQAAFAQLIESVRPS
jgi:CHAD domain-containing protein